MSPFVLIALAALLGFIVGWFAHGPKETAASPVAAPVPAVPVGLNPLAAEVTRLKQEVASLQTRSAGLEAMVHGRDSTIVSMAKEQRKTLA